MSESGRHIAGLQLVSHLWPSLGGAVGGWGGVSGTDCPRERF